jgi:hypothetical protein
MVTVPWFSATQKLGLSHSLLTDREFLPGSEEAVVYWTLMMLSLQTSSLSRPLSRLKVTPAASAA